MLESVEGGEQVGRYTFIGIEPFQRIVARGRTITITEGKRVVEVEDDIFAVLRRALSGHKAARLPGLPPFTAGAVGFLSYDAVRQIERLPSLTKDELGVLSMPVSSSSMRCSPSITSAKRSGSSSPPTSPAAKLRPILPRPTARPSSDSMPWRSVSLSHCRRASRRSRATTASSK